MSGKGRSVKIRQGLQLLGFGLVVGHEGELEEEREVMHLVRGIMRDGCQHSLHVLVKRVVFWEDIVDVHDGHCFAELLEGGLREVGGASKKRRVFGPFIHD